MAQCGPQNYYRQAIRNLNNPIEREFNCCWPNPNDPNTLCRELERCMKQQELNCPAQQSRPHSAPPTFPQWRQTRQEQRFNEIGCVTDPCDDAYLTNTCGLPSATCASYGGPVPQGCLDMTVYGRSLSPRNCRQLWLAQCQRPNTPAETPSSSCSSEASDESCDDEETQTPENLRPTGSETLLRIPAETKLKIPASPAGPPVASPSIAKTSNQTVIPSSIPLTTPGSSTFDISDSTVVSSSTNVLTRPASNKSSPVPAPSIAKTPSKTAIPSSIPLTTPGSSTFDLSNSAVASSSIDLLLAPAPKRSVSISIEQGNPEAFSGPVDIDVKINQDTDPNNAIDEISVDYPPDSVVEISHGKPGSAQITAAIPSSVTSLSPGATTPSVVTLAKPSRSLRSNKSKPSLQKLSAPPSSVKLSPSVGALSTPSESTTGVNESNIDISIVLGGQNPGVPKTPESTITEIGNGGGDPRKQRITESSPKAPATAATSAECSEEDEKIMEKLRKKNSCPICKEILFHTVRMTACSHSFCRYCLLQYIHEGKKKCPVCKKNYKGFSLKPGVDACIDEQFEKVCEKYQKERETLIASRYFPERQLCRQHAETCQLEKCQESKSKGQLVSDTQDEGQGQLPSDPQDEGQEVKYDVDLFCQMMKNGPIDPQFHAAMVCQKLHDGTLDPDKNRIHQFLSLCPDRASKCERFCKLMREQKSKAKIQGRSKSESGKADKNRGGGGMPYTSSNVFNSYTPAIPGWSSEPNKTPKDVQLTLPQGQSLPTSKSRTKTGTKVKVKGIETADFNIYETESSGMKPKIKKSRPKTTLSTTGGTKAKKGHTSGQQPPFPPMSTQMTFDMYQQMMPTSDYYKNKKGCRTDMMGVNEKVAKKPNPGQDVNTGSNFLAKGFSGGGTLQNQRLSAGFNSEPYRNTPLQYPLYQPMAYSSFHHHPMNQFYDPHKYAFKPGGPNPLHYSSPIPCREPAKPIRVKRDIEKQVKEYQMIEQAKLLERAVKECQAGRRQKYCPEQPYLRMTCPINYSMPRVRMDDRCCPPEVSESKK